MGVLMGGDWYLEGGGGFLLSMGRICCRLMSYHQELDVLSQWGLSYVTFLANFIGSLFLIHCPCLCYASLTFLTLLIQCSKP